ncbi:MAG: hypothetical protein L6R30_02765 [Thermoanaerobaculia bacterium]|nr:hypothetical protein [Thermoanaerobaculia bacterium]
MAVSEASRTPGGVLYGLYLASLAVSLCGNLVIRLGERAGWLPAPARVVLAVLASVPLVLAAVFFWRMLRGTLDEMLQRIVLEGLAFAFVLYVPVTAVYLNLRTAAVWLPRLDPADLLIAPALLVAIGLFVSSRRYS